jgi:hypothetical protein
MNFSKGYLNVLHCHHRNQLKYAQQIEYPKLIQHKTERLNV